MIPTPTRLAMLERDFGRLADADQPRVSEILSEGAKQMREGTSVEPELDTDQLWIDAQKPGLEGAMARGWLRVLASRRERGAPPATATLTYAPPTAAAAPKPSDDPVAQIYRRLSGNV